MGVVVDSNVPHVACGLTPEAGAACNHACVQRLARIMRDGGLLLDADGLILHEYLRKLGFAGKPGAGRAFVKWAYDNQFNDGLCRRVPITRTDDGWRRFAEFPDDNALRGFDVSDQKFVAVALASDEDPPILNAVDSDWWNYGPALARHGVVVENLCPEHRAAVS